MNYRQTKVLEKVINNPVMARSFLRTIERLGFKIPSRMSDEQACAVAAKAAISIIHELRKKDAN